MNPLFLGGVAKIAMILGSPPKKNSYITYLLYKSEAPEHLGGVKIMSLTWRITPASK